MDFNDLDHIINEGEGYFAEFKRSVSSDLAKEMVAFSNASGGNIYVGIDDYWCIVQRF